VLGSQDWVWSSEWSPVEESPCTRRPVKGEFFQPIRIGMQVDIWDC